MKTLILYSSKYGCTTKIVQRISSQIETDVINIERKEIINLVSYDLVIIGSSVYMGSINRKIKKFIKNNLEILKSKKVALFICGLANGNELEDEYNKNFPLELRKISIVSGMFLGEAILNKMNFFSRFIIKKVYKTDKDICKLNFKEVDRFISKLK